MAAKPIPARFAFKYPQNEIQPQIFPLFSVLPRAFEGKTNTPQDTQIELADRNSMQPLSLAQQKIWALELLVLTRFRKSM